MAPVVHGLEEVYRARVDFLYLDVSDPRNRMATSRLGFRSTPHFFFLREDGTEVAEMQGVVPRDSLTGALNRLIAGEP